MDDYDLPVVDLSEWMRKGEGNPEDCRRLANSLHRFGIVLVRDPRVSEVDNNSFLDQMEKYFAQSDGVKDARPEVRSILLQHKLLSFFLFFSMEVTLVLRLAPPRVHLTSKRVE